MKSVVNPFIDNALAFSNSLFNSFSTSTCFVLFEVTFLFIFLVYHENLSFTKLAISLLLAELAGANIAVNVSDVNLLNS